MALSVSTNNTNITDGETVTGWSNYGSGGAGATALEPDYFAQGSNCISRGVTGAATNKGMCFDIGAGNVLNFTTTHVGKLVYIWMRTSTPGLCDTIANGGIRIVLGSGATAPGDAAGVWSAWYVDGSDSIDATDGWKCYIIDPTLPPSTSFGGGVDITAIRWFGGVMRSTGTVKGQNFGIDRVSYGIGEIIVTGTNTTAGNGFNEIADADFGTVANRYGLVVRKEGIILVQGKIIIGDGTGTLSTDFSSENEIVIWERKTYYDGTGRRSCFNDFNHATEASYCGMDFRGNGTGNTNVIFGAKVGTGDTAKGRSGPTFIGAHMNTTFDFDDGNVENVLIYGTTFRNISKIDGYANASTDEFIGNNIIQCGTFLPGPMKVRACNFIDNIGGSYKIYEDFFLVGGSHKTPLTAVASTLDILGGQGFISLNDPGSSDRRNAQQITAIDSAGLTITVNAAARTFTRSAGSYLTDGFRAGNVVQFYGFTNAVNNVQKVIQSVTATVITVTVAGAITNETGNGDERVVRGDGVGSDDHYAEALIYWPSSGANQGSWGVTIRGAAGATENYWYLKCDLRNSLMSLIRCDAGTDTTVASTAYSFAEDTFYLAHLVGRGTLIEAFVNGTKLSTTSSTYQTNRRVGWRGDAEADQTGGNPRLSRFGAGPTTTAGGLPFTTIWGALGLYSANDDIQTCSFINNSRALSINSTGTYDLTNNSFSGNLVDIRNDSSGAATVNIIGSGGAPTVKEEVDDAITTINNSVTLTITCKNESNSPIQDVQVGIFKSSDLTQLMNELTDSSGIATESFAFSTDTPIIIRARKSTSAPVYFPFETTGTITSAGFTLSIVLTLDNVIT